MQLILCCSLLHVLNGIASVHEVGSWIWQWHLCFFERVLI